MIVAGIIAEYNPFHKGHQYHIEQTRKLTNADYVVVVMSPDYVQRGAPALIDKHTRTQMALQGGADLVVELPLEVACSSAEFFATGGINILDKLKVIDYCSFGSELGSIEPFGKIANTLLAEPKTFQDTLRAGLKSGLSFPVARKNALLMENPSYADVLDSPNNILGIEYCKSLISCNSRIKPITIMRTSDNYHNTNITGEFSSASAIRKTLLTNAGTLSSGDIDINDVLANVQDIIPNVSFETLKDTWLVNGPLDEDDFSPLLKYKLLSETADSLISYLDVSESLANRIIKSLNDFRCFSQFADLLKSKELTRTRINRALLHILLDIKKIPAIDYARILGFRKTAQPLLSELKKSSSIPIITKPTDVDYNVFGANLYESLLSDKYNRSFVHEYSKPVVIVE